MGERILVATDFSPAGTRAVAAAARWAAREGAELRLLHVVPPRRWLTGFGPGAPARGVVVQRAAAALRAAAAAIDPDRRLALSTGVVEGPAARRIEREAREFGATLLVVGARGERDGEDPAPGLGGTSAKLLARTRAPLLLVRRGPADHAPVVVGAIDLTPVSAAVLAWARRAATGGRLHVLHVYEVPFAGRLEAYGLAERAIDVYSGDERTRRERELAALVAGATDRALEVRTILERGDAARHLHAHARRVEADCVVLGRHSKLVARPPSTTYGSVCRYAATFLPTDVLVVPPAARH